MSVVGSSRAIMLRTLAQQVSFKPVGAVVEGAGQPESEHMNPAWVRRCVASYMKKGSMSKEAPPSIDREGVSKAFAVCRSQYNEFEDKGDKNASAFKGKKGKKRLGQYEKILAKVRGKPS